MDICQCIKSNVVLLFINILGMYVQYYRRTIFTTDKSQIMLESKPLHCTPGAVSYIKSLYWVFSNQIQTVYVILQLTKVYK